MKIRSAFAAAALAAGVITTGVVGAAPASAHVTGCASYDYVVWGTNGIPYCFSTAAGTCSTDDIYRAVDRISVLPPNAWLHVIPTSGVANSFNLFHGVTSLNGLVVATIQECH
jgi:hypothetical protein